MNLSKQIKEWLDSPSSFNKGLDLLRSTGQSDQYHRMRQYTNLHFVPPAAKSQLTQYLRDYLLLYPPATSSQAPALVQPAKAEEPPAIVALRKSAKNYLKERDARRAQLVQMVEEPDRYTDQDRYQLAIEVMLVQEDIDATYQRITQYEQDGELPEEIDQTGIVEDTVKKFQRVLSIRPAISRSKKKLENKGLSAKKREELETDLLDKMIELEDLERELGL